MRWRSPSTTALYGTPPSIEFVNLLAREHAEATFFEIGRQISEYDRRGTSSAGCSPTAT